MRAVVVLGLVAGCGADPCRSGTLFISYTLSGGVEAADTLDVTLIVGSSAPVTKRVARSGGARSGSIEVDFAGAYPNGQSLSLRLAARAGEGWLGESEQTTLAQPGCTSLTFSLDGGNDLSVAPDLLPCIADNTGICAERNCGTVKNSCGREVSCGACNPPTHCGAETPGVCGCTADNTAACQGKLCGYATNNCGEVTHCGLCAGGETCGANQIESQCEVGPCTPRTCAELGKNCGIVPDGCDSVLDCGSCTNPGDTCGGGGTANVCGCTPDNAEACVGKECGAASNNCKQPTSCGGCTPPEMCGGGGEPNQCGCTPDNAGACAGKNCGKVTNNCGQEVSCGSGCVAPETCGGGGKLNRCGCSDDGTACGGKNCGTVTNNCGKQVICTPNQCAAPQTCGGSGTPNVCGCTSDGKACMGKNCGLATDNCGQQISCGSPTCPTGESCGAISPNVCGPGICVEDNAAACAGKSCGAVANNCGRVVSCGSGCVGPETCGGGGVPNVCGCTVDGTACVGKSCGMVSSNCGNPVSCGSCTLPNSCGGGGLANVCDCSDPAACNGKNCGTVMNACGVEVSCGSPCVAPETCGGGGMPNVCGCMDPDACTNKNCGTVTDHCGNLVACGGACPGAQTCGGGGTPNVCGYPTPSSCVGLAINCGPSGNEDCCKSLLVPGGTFYRSYDGTATYSDMTHPATLSDFRLDKYEVTVGRFRKFVDAVIAGYLPTAGAGKHTHVNGGQGLVATSGGYELGWDSSWPAVAVASGGATSFPTTAAGWNDAGHLGCGATVWTATAGSKERIAVNCINWYQAYAFCIWDGGFLPSEAEWNYAASGGDEQRVYPWSVPASSTTIDSTFAVYNNASINVNVGSKSPKGNGRWGHADLAGNRWEWTLDYYLATFASQSCADCATLIYTPEHHVTKGGGYTSTSANLAASYRYGFYTHWDRDHNLGFRCARRN